MIGQAVGSLLSGIGTIATSVIDAGASVLTGLGAVANLSLSAVGLTDLGNAVGNILTPGGAPYSSGSRLTVGNFDFSPDAVDGRYSPFSLTSAFNLKMDRLFDPPAAGAPPLDSGASVASAEAGAPAVGDAAETASVEGSASGPVADTQDSAAIKPLDPIKAPTNPYTSQYAERFPMDDEAKAQQLADPTAFAEERLGSASVLAAELASGDEQLSMKLLQHEMMVANPAAAGLSAAQAALEADPDNPLKQRRLEAAQRQALSAANQFGYIFEPDKAAPAAIVAQAGVSTAAAEVREQLKTVNSSTLKGPSNPYLDGVPKRKLRMAEQLISEGDALLDSDPAAALRIYQQASNMLSDAQDSFAMLSRETYKDNFRIKSRLTGESLGWDWESITPWLSIATTFGLAYMQNEKQEKVDEKNRRYMDKVREDEQAFQREMQGQRLDAQMAMAGMAASAASPASVGVARPQTIGGGTASA